MARFASANTIPGALDRFRACLDGKLDGLSQDLLASPSQLGAEEGRACLRMIRDTLSEFFGAQYSVFEGCRLVAKGEV